MVHDVLVLAGAALSLDRSALVAAQGAAGSGAGLILALLAGLSLTLGQSVVLFGNSVSPRRFALCLLLFATAFVFGLVAWGVSIWLIAVYVFRLELSPGRVLLTVGMGQAPLLFGFLILVPYFGASIRRILEAYSLVIVVAALSLSLEVRPLVALAISGLGWGLKALALSLLQRPLAGMHLRLWQVVSGRAELIAPGETWRTLVADERSNGGGPRVDP